MNKLSVYENIIEAIGNTPLIKLNEISADIGATVYCKFESFNPGLSIKDRTAIYMIHKAEMEGRLKPGGTVVEATSGNMGFSLAMVAAVKGYDCILTVKDSASQEKINAIKAMGATVVLCPSNAKPEDSRSYYSAAKLISEKIEGACYINQNFNLHNEKAHYYSTAYEIWEQTEGKVTHLIASASTGGTISGVARYLKEQNEDIKVYASDSNGSVLQKYHQEKIYDKSLKRKTVLEGVGKDIITANFNFDKIDEFIKVKDENAIEQIICLAKNEGVMAGTSSGAALAALDKIKMKLLPTDVVVVIFPDHGSKYLSKAFDFEWRKKNQMENQEEDELTKVINDYYFL